MYKRNKKIFVGVENPPLEFIYFCKQMLNLIPVAVLHVPDKLKLLHSDLRIFPLELWRLFVLVELDHPLLLNR